MRHTNAVQIMFCALRSHPLRSKNDLERLIIQIAKSCSKKELDAQDDDGNTALHLAAIKGYINLYEQLRELGANDAVHNKDGNAAMDILAAP